MFNFYNNRFNSREVPRHKTFISFYHTDEYYKDLLETKLGNQYNGFVSKSVSDGDINTYLSTDTIRQIIRDDFISDATVTLVLIGNGTWRRKYVDWEIGSSIRATRKNTRTGLLGILLPTYSAQSSWFMQDNELKRTENGFSYSPYNIPPRLYDNIECGFAKIYSWPSNLNDIKVWIDEAFKIRHKVLPVNSRPGFSNNRSEDNLGWGK